MLSQKIRQGFLHYFKSKGHSIVPSSSVVPYDDPTLLFTNAGMNQFKDVFLGKSLRDYTKATSSQKCIRVGGKHNDLENVGHTSRHLTFFEMLGNFSFGDYFKAEAIASAWDVAQNVFGFDKSLLWVTVFHEDDESFDLWTRFVSPDRILRFGEKDNFWSMGETGPCGPCTELYFDRGPSWGTARNPSEDFHGERYIEFWNLVFMQFNRDLSGTLHPLPKKSVDTGAGLERVVSLKMGTPSLFETDILRSLIAQVENLSGKSYVADSQEAPPFRVLADHLRTLAFAISDGVQPSNIERGYVLRKVVRRAVRYGRQLGFDRPFLASLLPRLVDLMGQDFPELVSSQGRVAEILTQEEESFLKTLKRGGNLLNQVIQQSQKTQEISGDDAFKLKDTYGLPLEEILLLAKDGGLKVDISRFEALEHEAKQKSRGSRKTATQMGEESLYEKYLETYGPTPFLGYQQLSTPAIILKILKEGREVPSLEAGEEGILLLNQTPFYAEKGGQVGDQGTLFKKEGVFDVLDCQTPFTDIITHTGVVRTGCLHVGDQVEAIVHAEKRQNIANNHTATHLLHWALEQVLGEHIRQAGSIVDGQRLRFDFSHHKGVSSEEIQKIEDLVNEKIRENQQVRVYELPFGEVQQRKDIKQFFGEKYGTSVRVIDIDYSKELCGGTHTHAVGTLGYFRIIKEGSVAAGVRRIEAVTGKAAESFAREAEKVVTNLATLMKSSPHALEERLEKLVEENKELRSQYEALRLQMLGFEVATLLEKKEVLGGVNFLAQVTDFDSQLLVDYADLIMKRCPSLVLLLIAKGDGKCSIVARVSLDLVGKGILAGELVKTVAPILGGKGGGKGESAQGGGTAPEKIPEALKAARNWLSQKV